MNEEEPGSTSPSQEPQSAPAKPPVVRPRRGAGKHATRIRAKSVRSAGFWVLAIAILQLAFGTWQGFATKSEADREIAKIEQMIADEEVDPDDAEPILVELNREVARSFAIPIGLGVVFLGLFFWARKSALPALCAALGLYVIVIGIGAAYSPSSIFRGILMKILVIVALASGIKSALQQRAIAQREAEPAA